MPFYYALERNTALYSLTREVQNASAVLCWSRKVRRKSLGDNHTANLVESISRSVNLYWEILSGAVIGLFHRSFAGLSNVAEVVFRRLDKVRPYIYFSRHCLNDAKIAAQEIGSHVFEEAISKGEFDSTPRFF